MNCSWRFIQTMIFNWCCGCQWTYHVIDYQPHSGWILFCGIQVMWLITLYESHDLSLWNHCWRETLNIYFLLAESHPYPESCSLPHRHSVLSIRGLYRRLLNFKLLWLHVASLSIKPETNTRTASSSVPRLGQLKSALLIEGVIRLHVFVSRGVVRVIFRLSAIKNTSPPLTVPGTYRC